MGFLFAPFVWLWRQFTGEPVTHRVTRAENTGSTSAPMSPGTSTSQYPTAVNRGLVSKTTAEAKAVSQWRMSETHASTRPLTPTSTRVVSAPLVTDPTGTSDLLLAAAILADNTPTAVTTPAAPAPAPVTSNHAPLLEREVPITPVTVRETTTDRSWTPDPTPPPAAPVHSHSSTSHDSGWSSSGSSHGSSSSSSFDSGSSGGGDSGGGGSSD